MEQIVDIADRIYGWIRRPETPLAIKTAIRPEDVIALMAEFRAAENEALEGFAKFLLEHRPSAAQIKISPEYNEAVLAALGWAANEARKRVQLGEAEA